MCLPRTPVRMEFAARAVALLGISKPHATPSRNRGGDPGPLQRTLGERGRGPALGQGVDLKATGGKCR